MKAINTNSTDPKILGKIKKCLALASSSNPNEAATALRQAHALMEKHGVTVHEMAASEIGEAQTASRTMSRDKPAHWEAQLCAVVAEAFGCKLIFSRHYLPKGYRPCNDGDFVFIGLKQQSEIAAYTASVLIRKCKKARQDWIAETFGGLTDVGVKKHKTKAGDSFAIGWVMSIKKLVSDFANPPEIADAIERYVQQQSSGNHAPTRNANEKGMDRVSQLAAAAGMQAAKGEALYRPMHTNEQPLKIAG